MKNLIKLEEAAMSGMIGYLVGNKVGAWMYNLFHHKSLAIFILCFGWSHGFEWLELAGIILLGHSSLDRMFGYGLKYLDSFKHTHLRWIGSDL